MLKINNIHNMNCIEGMNLIPDNYIDLIITDPPYSLNYDFENDRLSQDEQYTLIHPGMK